MSMVLRLAAAYNLLWGAWVVLFPRAFFTLVHMEQPNYPQIWQSVGMIVGVYGIGYAIAAMNPTRHWPVVLVGMLGKLMGPVGFLYSVFQGSLPWRFGTLCLFNDLIWWVPFTLILYGAWRANTQESVISL